ASREDNPCVRSAVFALNPATGAIEWTHWTAPADTLGGGIWSSMSADPAKHALLVTTSNACPFGPVAGDEDAILALDWDTGATQWRYTAIHRDDDFDFGQGAVSFTYDGVPYVVAGNKYGMVYSVVPPTASGGQPRLAWATRITGAGYLSFSGIYQPPAYLNGVIYVAGGPTLDNACPKGAIWALDARSGAPRWRQCTASQVVSPGAISGNVLFIADNNGIYGFDVNTGRKVWSAPLTGPLWGGIAIVGGMVVVGTVPGDLHAYSLPAA
ncbi:MAG TPA: PQQ-binding-like beta-propeller repeat protein, partial [Ktedonobacterales bacterium]